MKKTLIFFATLFTFSTVLMPVAIAQTQLGASFVTGTEGQPLQILATTANTLTARFILPELKITTQSLSDEGNPNRYTN